MDASCRLAAIWRRVKSHLGHEERICGIEVTRAEVRHSTLRRPFISPHFHVINPVERGGTHTFKLRTPSRQSSSGRLVPRNVALSGATLLLGQLLLHGLVRLWWMHSILAFIRHVKSIGKLSRDLVDRMALLNRFDTQI